MTFVLEVLMNKHLELKNRIRELRIKKRFVANPTGKNGGNNSEYD